MIVFDAPSLVDAAPGRGGVPERTLLHDLSPSPAAPMVTRTGAFDTDGGKPNAATQAGQPAAPSTTVQPDGANQGCGWWTARTGPGGAAWPVPSARANSGGGGRPSSTVAPIR